MKFRFCGDADCPDWILAEIYTLSKLSSIKLKQLAQIVVQGILKPPLDTLKAQKLFNESKLDPDIDLKACMACISFIVSSAVRFNCNSSALLSELQQLGLPREHSNSIKRLVNDHCDDLTTHFRKSSLRVNNLEKVTAEIDHSTGCIVLDLVINGEKEQVTMIPHTAKLLLKDLKKVREKITQLNESEVFL